MSDRAPEPVVRNKDRFVWPVVALIGAAVMLVVIFLLFPTAPKVASPAPPGQAVAQPEGDILQLSDLKVQPSPPRDGTRTVKLTGRIQNVGGPEVTGATLEARFMSKGAGTALVQAQPVSRVRAEGAAEKDVSLADHPLKSGNAAVFEAEFVGVPDDWDGQLPELRIVAIDSPAKPAGLEAGEPGEDEGKPSPGVEKKRRAR